MLETKFISKTGPERAMNTARGVGRVTALALVPWHAEAPGQVVAAAAVVVVAAAAVVVVAVVVAVVGMVGRVGERTAAVVGRRRNEEIAPGPHHGAAQKSRGVLRRRIALYQYRLPRAVAQAAFCTKKKHMQSVFRRRVALYQY